MHAVAASVSTVTEAEYLARERRARDKHEYLGGEVFAMAGATREHNLIAANLLRELGNALRERPCEVYPSDMRVRVAQTGLYTYPDVAVVCGAPAFADDQRDTLLNPAALFEVLSRSTEAYDRGEKFAHYRRLDSLQNYVLLSQDKPLIETYHVQPDGSWLLREHCAGERALVAALGIDLTVDEIYHKVFAAADASA